MDEQIHLHLWPLIAVIIIGLIVKHQYDKRRGMTMIGWGRSKPGMAPRLVLGWLLWGSLVYLAMKVFILK